jgi:hypothetical protein
MKLGMHLKDIMIHCPFKFDSMSTKIGLVRDGFRKRRNNWQMHGSADSSPVVL